MSVPTNPPPNPEQAATDSPAVDTLDRSGATLYRQEHLQPPLLQRRLLRALRFVFGAVLTLYFIFCGLVLVLRHVILPNIHEYRGEIERAVSTALHAPVAIADLQAGWMGLRPRLNLRNVSVFDPNGRTALLLPEVNATLSWESLALGELQLDALEIIKPDLDIRRDASGKIFVAGLALDHEDDSRAGFAEWALEQREILIRDARVRWNDELRKAPELTLEQVNFVLQKSGRRRLFGLTVVPPQHLAAPLDVRGRFEIPSFATRLSDTDRWRGELYLRVGAADLAAWPTWLDYPMELSRGTGALRAWLEFSSRQQAAGPADRLLTLTADLRLANVITRLKRDLPALALTTVDGRVRARTLANGHEFSLRGFHLVSGDGLSVEMGELSEKYSIAANGKAEQGELRTDSLNLETLAMVAERFPLGEGPRKMLEQYQPRGVVSNLAFKWQGPINAPLDYNLSATFDGLSILPQASPVSTDGHEHPGRPGFTNLNGAVIANGHSGTVNLNAPAGVLRLPGIFAEPDLRLFKLSGEVHWTHDGANLEVRLPNLVFENEDAAGTANAIWRAGPKSGATPGGPGWLDLQGKLTRADARRVPRYLPVVLSSSLRSWLVAAIQGGVSSDTSFHVKGDLQRFPFGASPGRAPRSDEIFRIVSRLRDVRFDYVALPAPGSLSHWPILEDVAGDLVFDRNSMQVRAATGSISGVRFERARADLDNLGDANSRSPLRISGNTSGALQDYVRFVGNTPVGGWIGGLLNGARASGNASLDLRLDLPLANMSAARVAGGLTLSGNDVVLTQAGLPVMQRVSGRVDFTESGVTLRNLNGQFLGGPFRLEGGARPDGLITLRGDGTALASSVKQMYSNAFLQKLGERLDGSARYSVAMNLRAKVGDGATAPAQIVIDSNLVGLSVDLPAPFHKVAAETLPMHLEIVPNGSSADEVRINLGPSFSAVFERKAGAQGEMNVVRAAYGVNEQAVLTDAAAYANINLKTLDLDAWQGALNQLAPSAAAGGATGGAARNNFLPDVIAIRTGQVRIFDKTLANVVFAASRANDVWQANLDADQVSGYLTWRDGATASQQGRLTARLARLHIPQTATTDVTSVLASSPRELPSLDIVAEDFELRDKKLGRLELSADNVRSGARREWRLQKLTLTNDDAVFDASGTWNPDAPGNRQTALNLKLTSGNAGKLMDRLGMKDTLRNGTASLRGDVNWRGSPFAIDFATMDGKLVLEADRGQFLKAEPGIAKLLGVLSLQGLPRRISLDFRDVFSDGFSFDTIRANVAIQNGTASTSDFNMRGVSAVVLIEGTADLGRETQNLHVLVMPQINAGGGSIVYALLANPVIGLATFVAQAILRDPLSRALSFEYNVSGSWAEPNITKVERSTSQNAATTEGSAPSSSTPSTPATK